jgi:hypothetical protein
MRYFQGGANNFTTGIDDSDDNFKMTKGSNLLSSSYGDSQTMLLAHASGILDFNNQSRARAYLNHVQFIPSATWTPIEFDFDSPSPVGYDEQNEFTPWPAAPTGNFIAKEEGYYQVHARTAYEWVMVEPPPLPHPFGHVSIRIVKTDAAGVKTVIAQGNNLMMLALLPSQDVLELLMNNAPNVSDVVYLRPGDMLEIEAWQDIDLNPLSLVSLYIGSDQTYVSIHKDS